MRAARIIAIAGTSSNVGKTTLLCDLLGELSGDGAWEAIKITRGHYRSCGKDPQACCVGHLLGDKPLVRSGHDETYTFGKDTGRYWDAGAANVHWLIATTDQVEIGVKEALSRVTAPNVLIEGTSFLKFIKADFAVMVARPDDVKIKPTARIAIEKKSIDAVYLSGNVQAETRLFGGIDIPTFTAADLPKLVSMMKKKMLDAEHDPKLDT